MINRDLTPQQYHRLREIFWQVCDLPRDQQAQRLEQLAGADITMRQLAIELLEFDRCPADLELTARRCFFGRWQTLARLRRSM